MAVTSPILDVFAVWHPEELGGERLFTRLDDHYHSPAFSGLAGGAVEVYARSAPWGRDGAPRPLGISDELAPGIVPAHRNVIILYVGAALATAFKNDPAWGRYIREIVELDACEHVKVYTLFKEDFDVAGSSIGKLVGDAQALTGVSLHEQGHLGREVSQAITQWITGTPQIRVFISHTKHSSLVETEANSGAHIAQQVRDEIRKTHLDDFFDAQDIQAGDDWQAVLDGNAKGSALLMVRTDKYAGREWTQREVLTAKTADVPIVCLHALTGGEERGSFLMDHVPSVPCSLANPGAGIAAALNSLVDEALKRALWEAQRVYHEGDGFDWLPVHAPEPVTLTQWLRVHQREDPGDQHVWIMHPDPPLGPQEREVVKSLCSLAGFTDSVEILTPRTFATRGGVVSS